jgi:hypothetical protein
MQIQGLDIRHEGRPDAGRHGIGVRGAGFLHRQLPFDGRHSRQIIGISRPPSAYSRAPLELSGGWP